MREGEPRHVVQQAWTDDETDRLAELISDGWSFSAAGRELGRTRNQCIGRWHRHVVRQLGEQAQ